MGLQDGKEAARQIILDGELMVFTLLQCSHVTLQLG